MEPLDGLRALAERQREVMAANRFGIPAQVHEECLTGLAAWRATIYPSPLCWAATFDPDLVERMGARIGATMRSLGIHQGLAPVLDVVRDLRWGRVEETLGEDPFLVGLIGSAYVRGLEGGGVVATLKHFVGYSASRPARNLAPVSVGPRELADVLLPPFEMALRAGARSVMNSYTDIDGVPAAADPSLLTTLLRDSSGSPAPWSPTTSRRLPADAAPRRRAASGRRPRLALRAGIDVELPSANAYGEPLLAAVADGIVDEKLVDRALDARAAAEVRARAARPGWAPAEPTTSTSTTPSLAALALELARRSVVLLANDGTLPLRGGRARRRGRPARGHAARRCSAATRSRCTCWSHYPGRRDRAWRSARSARRWPTRTTSSTPLGCPVLGGSDEDIAAAAEAARGRRRLRRRAGRPGRAVRQGHVRRGLRRRRPAAARAARRSCSRRCSRPARRSSLVLLVGRPYDLSRQADRLAGLVCGFFPGEEGAQAVADVLSGRVNPSGRLPVSFPGAGSTQPSTYLAPALGQRNEVSVVDPTAAVPVRARAVLRRGHLGRCPCRRSPTWDTDGECEVVVELANETDRAVRRWCRSTCTTGRPRWCGRCSSWSAAARVDLAPGSAARVWFALHADLTSFTGRDLVRIVEPGAVELRVGGVERGHPSSRCRWSSSGPHAGGRRRPGAGARRWRRAGLMHDDLSLAGLWTDRSALAAPDDLLGSRRSRPRQLDPT